MARPYLGARLLHGLTMQLAQVNGRRLEEQMHLGINPARCTFTSHSRPKDHLRVRDCESCDLLSLVFAVVRDAATAEHVYVHCAESLPQVAVWLETRSSLQ